MGETKVTRDLAELLEKILGKDKIDINFEHLPKDKKILRSLFETSSKRFTKNRGKPDLIVEFNKGGSNPKNILIICECKKKIKDHCIADNPLATDCPEIYACSGVLHYLKHAHEVIHNSKNKKLSNLDLIGIAYSKDLSTNESKIDIYGINSRFNEINPTIKCFSDDVYHYSVEDLPNIIIELRDLVTLYPKVWISTYNLTQLGIIPINIILNLKFSYEITNKKQKYRFQRSLSQFKVDTIFNYYHDESHKNKKNNKSKDLSPQGILLLGRYNNNYYILDGQHRLASYHRLYKKGVSNFDVLVQLTEYDNAKKMLDDFRAYNSGSGLTTVEYEYIENLDTEIKNKSDPKVETIINSKVETVINPKVETIINPKPETVINPKPETVINPKVETVINPKVETVINPKVETVINPKVETVINPKVETIINPKTETIINPKPETIINPKVETIINPKVETIINPKVEILLKQEKETELSYIMRLIDAVTRVCDYYAKFYRKSFSNSPSCYRPNIHYKTMKSKLQKRVLSLNRFKSYKEDELFEAIKKSVNKLNENFKRDYKNSKNKDILKFYPKCTNKGGFYLGIVSKCKWIELIT